MDNLQYWIFTPSKWQERNGWTIDMDRCRASVWQDFSNYQCSRKVKEPIGDYKFCTQHAKLIKKLDAKDAT